MFLKRLQLGLVHVAVAMTLVPINSTLNRVMIKELALSATLVTALAVLPYLFSPMQVAIGAYSDRHPIFGRRRTPYIVLGLLLCALGVIVSPQAAFALAENPWPGALYAALAFGAWGMGFNLASVSYLSLATELSGEKGRGRTIAVMWFMMIVSIILTAILVSHMVDPYTPEALQRATLTVGLAALALGALGLIGLEKRESGPGPAGENHTIRQMLAAIAGNPQARLFFIYLLLLLAAILGQDVLLEPYGAEAFGLRVDQTTRITSIWGGSVLVAILAAGALETRVPKRSVAQAGNLGALAGFLLILSSGFSASTSLFYSGVVLLGLGTGLSTVANLALMFDLTAPGQIGLFIGAWGVSNAFSRLTGLLLGGVVRDLVTLGTSRPLAGYMVVFGLEAAMLLAAVFLLGRIDVGAFQRQVQTPDLLERVALSE